MSSNSFDIVTIDQVAIEDVAGAIGTVFGARTPDWYRWKHLDNPAGPSLGWAAIDQDGVAGVRLLQRWNLLVAGEIRRALRPVDTVTVPRAQRRGIFQALLDVALDHLDGETDLLFNTPNQNSQPGYVKNGWKLLDPIAHGVRPTIPGPRLGAPIDPAALPFPTDVEATITTARSPDYLAWRYDRRSGHDYRGSASLGDDRPAGVVYRVTTRKRSKALILCDCFGPASTVSRLVASSSRRERAIIAIAAVGTGTPEPSALPRHVVRGSTVLAVRPIADLEPDPLALKSWRLSLGDLENVI